MSSHVLKCVFITTLTLILTSAMIEKLPMPEGLKIYFNGAKMTHNLSEVPGEHIFWECMQKVMWQMAEMLGHNVTRETRDYFNRLLQIAIDSHDAQIPRHRKEYRMLTDEERERFHNAILALKNDTSLVPNVYSAIAELHAGDVIPMAHFGANFPGWHRIFLLLFETALRMKDPSIAVPYWASNLDSEMEDPSKSIIWSEDFMGNGDGFVTSGPFANFRVHTTDSILTRNIGESGSLYTNEGIHGILSQNHTSQITSPGAAFQNNLEQQHNTVHFWVGGNMDDLSTSAEDPIFHIHHSFVDYIWEEFRTKQKLQGINPELDYPQTNFGPKTHAPGAPIGFGDLRNVDALANVFADLVKYEPSPVCTLRHPTCRSKYLRCDTIRPVPICISLSREEVNKKLDNELEICVEPHLSRSVQNNFAINQFCDIRKWAYITVSIVLQRPPEFAYYKAFPVINNEPVTTSDIFSTISVQKNISRILATYPSCRQTNSVARKIFIESHGLNYYGKYKDFTVLDQRHALSSATTYIGIKSPESNYTDVILYAYDFCGRSCRPYCLDLSSFPPKSKPCAGVIRVTPEEPKLYGTSYADAVNNVWQADHPDALPEIVQNPAAVTFYCDYSGAWPWDEEIQASRIQKSPNNMRANKNIPAAKSLGKGQKISPKEIKTKSVKSKPELKQSVRAPSRTTAKSIQTTKTVNEINHIPIVRTFDLRSATSRPPVPRSKLSRNLSGNGARRMDSSVRTVNAVNSNQRSVRRNPLFRNTDVLQNPNIVNQRNRMSPRLQSK